MAVAVVVVVQRRDQSQPLDDALFVFRHGASSSEGSMPHILFKAKCHVHMNPESVSEWGPLPLGQA